MKKEKSVRITSIILVLMLTLSILMFGACEKGKDLSNTTGIKTASTSTVKTATKSVTSKPSSTISDNVSKPDVSFGTETAKNIENKQEQLIDNNTDIVQTDDQYNDDKQFVKTLDLKGRRILCLSWAGTTGSFFNPFELNNEDKISRVQYNRIKKTEELFNCKFDFKKSDVNSGQLNTQFETASLAGVYFADMFATQRVSAIPKYEKNNMMLAFNDYIDFSHPLWKKFNHTVGMLNSSKVYSIYDLGVWQTYGIWFVPSIFDREGVPYPQYYKDNGQWDWNNFIDVGQKLTKDFDGDGKIDQWGISSQTPTTLGTAILYSNKVGLIGTKAGKISYMLDEPRALRAVQFVSDLYNTYKVVNPSNVSTTGFSKYTNAIYVNWDWYALSYFKPAGLDVRYEEMPVGPDSMGDSYQMFNVSGNIWIMTAATPNPEEVANAFAYYACLWDDSLEEYITADDIFGYQAGLRMYDADKERLLNIYREKTNITLDYANNFKAATSLISTEVFNKISKMDTTAFTAIYSIKDAVQEMVNGEVIY